MKHYSELYHREAIVTEEALQAIEPLPCMTELDEAQTLEEMEKVIDK